MKESCEEEKIIKFHKKVKLSSRTGTTTFIYNQLREYINSVLNFEENTSINVSSKTHWQCVPKDQEELKDIPTAVFGFLACTFVIMQRWFWACGSGDVASMCAACWLVAIVVFPYLAGRNKSPFQKEAEYIHSNFRPFAQEPSEIRAKKLEWHFTNIQSYDKENQRKTGRIAQHIYTQFRKPKGKWQTIQTFPITDYK